jgi:SAM-dependent methyltransferase
MNAPPPDVELVGVECPLGCPPGEDPVVEGGDRLHCMPGWFRVVRCRTCSLIRTNPRPSESTIGYYYPSDYSPYHAADMRSAKPVAGWRRALRTGLGLDARRLPTRGPGAILEVGCANGSWLSSIQDQGWKCHGIEFSAEAAAHARSRGIAVQIGSVESVSPPQHPVDVVAAWMVLEHLHHPVRTLTTLRQWVKADGWLVASVPDAAALEFRLFGSRWFALQLPTHLYHYTPRTLTMVLAKAGWQVERITWQRNPNNLLNSLCYLAEDKRLGWLGSFARWVKDAPSASKLRLLLGVVLGALRQSGRMEVWARPRGASPGGMD